MKHVDIYTDGACKGNPGPGGYAAILVYKQTEKKLSQGYFNTTNNRMELMAAIVGLRALNEKCEVSLYSDSKYLVDAMNKGWVTSWKQKGWKKSDGKKALNVDLWEKILELNSFHEVEYIWVKGHDGHLYNEMCDKMAVESAENPTEKDIIPFPRYVQTRWSTRRERAVHSVRHSFRSIYIAAATLRALLHTAVPQAR